MEKKLHWIVKTVVIVLIVLVLVVLVMVFAKPGTGENDLTLITENYTLEPASYTRNGAIMVPLRSFADFVEAEVKLNTEDMTYEITRNGVTVIIKNGDENISVNGEQTIVDNMPEEREGLQYAPLEIFSGYLGVECKHNREEKTITVREP